MAKGQWYYCLDHHTVEPYEACKSETRLGPYPTAADAAQALEKVASRNVEWDNDPRFNDDDDEREEDKDKDEGPFAT